MQMFQKGRSMIEMLGVLAIIGVLSIGGLLGYRRAVNNHQANTILDDVNRFAFVIMESGRAFSTNAFIDNIEYSKTSTYNLDAFLGAGAGQFGIVVTDVPKGVCEPLVDKANIDYKVRVLSANTAESVAQLSANGTVYDSFHKDICSNDMNDVILYFGDTSTQCNAPNESGYTPCTENSDCCGGYFCWFANNTNCYSSGVGECKKVSDYNPDTKTMSDNKTWTHSTKTMNWWSAQNWCKAQGKKPVSRADIGCAGVLRGSYCTTSDTLKAIQGQWGSYGFHWLEDYGNSCLAYDVYFVNSLVTTGYRDHNSAYALCQ